MTTEPGRKIRYHYGNGLRKFRRIFDLTHKETAALLGMTAPQLTALERKELWTEEELRQTCERLNVPVSGIAFLAEERPPASFTIQHNTLGDSGIIGINNYLNKCDRACDVKIAGLLEKVEHTLRELSEKVESLEKKIEQLFPPEGNQYSPKVVDKLARVYTREGKEE